MYLLLNTLVYILTLKTHPIHLLHSVLEIDTLGTKDNKAVTPIFQQKKNPGERVLPQGNLDSGQGKSVYILSPFSSINLNVSRFFKVYYRPIAPSWYLRFSPRRGRFAPIPLRTRSTLPGC
jgi:hypothetical protein